MIEVLLAGSHYVHITRDEPAARDMFAQYTLCRMVLYSGNFARNGPMGGVYCTRCVALEAAAKRARITEEKA